MNGHDRPNTRQALYKEAKQQVIVAYSIEVKNVKFMLSGSLVHLIEKGKPVTRAVLNHPLVFICL